MNQFHQRRKPPTVEVVPLATDRPMAWRFARAEVVLAPSLDAIAARSRLGPTFVQLALQIGEIEARGQVHAQGCDRHGLLYAQGMAVGTGFQNIGIGDDR